MMPAHPTIVLNLQEITGHVRPMALASAIHAGLPSSWGGAFFVTLNNIRDCIEAGDRWFEEEAPGGFRISTDSGFSCIVRDRLAYRSVSPTMPERETAANDADEAENPIPFDGGDA